MCIALDGIKEDARKEERKRARKKMREEKYKEYTALLKNSNLPPEECARLIGVPVDKFLDIINKADSGLVYEVSLQSINNLKNEEIHSHEALEDIKEDGRKEERKKQYLNMLNSGKLSLEECATIAKVSVEEFLAVIDETGND